VQVQLIDGRPSRFVWRGRLYTVLSVIERPGDRPEPADAVSGPLSADRTAGAGKHSGGEMESEQHNHGPAEWRCWRVTASAGRNVPAAAFTLCQDQVFDRWQLSRE
jgi:hypothetical protein